MEATRSQLSDMRTLDLVRSTSMRALPESLGQLTSLQTLNLGECSSLRALPESLGQLTSLEWLSVWGCLSLTLPESLRALPSLRISSRRHSSPDLCQIL
jgi:Leucine-rich repeat (LRR) protein